MTDEERKDTEEPQTAESDALLTLGEVEDAIAFLQDISNKAEEYKDNPEELERLTKSALETMGRLQRAFNGLNNAAQMLTDETILRESGLNDLYSLKLIERFLDGFSGYMQLTADAIEKLQQVWSIPRITIKDAHKADYPLDRPNSIIWDELKNAKKDVNGQQKLGIKGGEECPVAYFYYIVDFSKLNNTHLSQSLTPFDKRCFIASEALRKAGNGISSVTQIFRMMGNKKTPNAKDLQKVNESLDKMLFTKVSIDNEPETKHRSDKPHYKYEGALLPHERVTAIINGKITDSAIHFLRESPLMEFARGRNEFTTIPRQLLETPLQKTDANIRLEGYFIERISHMKNSESVPRKMLYSTIFDKCKINTRMQQYRAPGTIERLLRHYASCKWISGYKMEEDGIIVILSK